MTQTAPEELQGTIERIIYQSNENGFAVFILKISSSSSTTVRGYLPTCNPGERVHITGSWVMHPKFGRQFEARDCTTQLPNTTSGLTKYLSSGLIKGIGPVYAEKLVSAFGDTVLDVIDKNPERLASVDGIGPKRIDTIITAWKSQKEIATIMVFLREKNISTSCATKIYKQYGAQAIAILHENPYRLSQDIWGIGFKTADTIAQHLGIASDSNKRIQAALYHTIQEQVNRGHLYIELEDLKTATKLLLELDTIDETITISLHALYNANKIILLSDATEHFITLPQYYASEQRTAERITRLLKHASKLTINIDAIYKQLRSAQDIISLSDDQQKGILSCLQNKVSIITGGPGTGKTTLIKQLIHIADQQKLMYKLAAPTGRAAKRITESTGRAATTIHRLLEFDASNYSFVKNEQNALAIDLVIIDEASMIDIFLAHAIIKAIPLDAHIVFIGDVNQLPSVGAGNFLHDAIASGIIPCVKLGTIFRQAQNSLIVVNAHRIHQGIMPISFLENTKKDYIFIKEEDPTTIATHLQTLYTQRLGSAGFKASDSIVLVPMNRGGVGTQALNHHLQTIINPISTEKKLVQHGTAFTIGDRVMQIRNNYDKLIFNGDIGTIQEIDIENQSIDVLFCGQHVTYESNELDELVLAYAITIHKSQGSEYPVVIIPIFTQHFALLQRTLIYTAVTRAKQLCILIGQPKAIAMGIKNTKGTLRKTFLKEFLTTDLKAR